MWIGEARIKSFEFARPNRGEQPTLGLPRRRSVKKRWNTVALPNGFAGRMRKRYRVLNARALKRDKGKHVERADAWMHATMRAQIDSLEGDGGKRDCGIEYRLPIPGNREHATMMDGVTGSMQYARTGCHDRIDRSVDCFRRAAFGEIRNDFEECHETCGYSSAAAIAEAMSR